MVVILPQDRGWEWQEGGTWFMGWGWTEASRTSQGSYPWLCPSTLCPGRFSRMTAYRGQMRGPENLRTRASLLEPGVKAREFVMVPAEQQ